MVHARSEGRRAAGGELLFRWKDWGADLIDAVAHGKVIEAKRPDRSASEGWDADPAEATTVELTFAWTRGRTIVHVREYGFPRRARVAASWPATAPAGARR